MTAYYTPNNGFTANDASFYKGWLAIYTIHIAVSFQLIVHTILKINIRGTTITFYKFAAKQPKNEKEKLRVRIFL